MARVVGSISTFKYIDIEGKHIFAKSFFKGVRIAPFALPHRDEQIKSDFYRDKILISNYFNLSNY